MKTVLIISGSFRREGNSHALARAFAAGAEQAGHAVEIVSLADRDIRFCRGCFACHGTHRCFMRDDADIIAQKMERADVLVFATPIYYYEMCGQLKTMLDRGNPLYDGDYAFRDVYVLTAAAEAEPEVPARAISGVEGWIECFPRARLAGTVFAGGVNDIGDIEGHPALEEAHRMGLSV